jgi:hypothetical protein
MDGWMDEWNGLAWNVKCISISVIWVIQVHGPPLRLHTLLQPINLPSISQNMLQIIAIAIVALA